MDLISTIYHATFVPRECLCSVDSRLERNNPSYGLMFGLEIQVGFDNLLNWLILITVAVE